jgi:hypothetical protein
MKVSEISIAAPATPVGIAGWINHEQFVFGKYLRPCR